MKTLGIIGFGSFGKFMANHLKNYFNVSVFDELNQETAATELGVNWQSLEQIVKNDILILAIPLQFLEKLLKTIGPNINEKTLVLDVTSVKVHPVKLMLKYLPPKVSIIATHPLFGPKSGANGIEGLKLSLCQVRSSKTNYLKVKKFLTETLKLHVIETTPDQHDQEAGYVMGLTHLIGQALNHLEIPSCEQTTKSFEHMMKLREMLSQDSMELFVTIQNYNPYVAKTRDQFYQTLETLSQKIHNQN